MPRRSASPLALFAAAASLVLITGCGGCGSSSSSAGGGSSQTLVYGRGGDADSLDPVKTSSGESVTVLTNVFDTLVTYDDTPGLSPQEKLEIVPALAESWRISEDGLVWTFKLREGVEFHDGTRFDADAAVFNLLRARDEGVSYAANFAAIESIEKAGDYEITLRLSKPSPILLNNLALFAASIGSPTAIKEDEDRFAQRPIGTGPFRFVSWQPKQKLTLASNENHWRGPPGVDRVIIVPVDQNAARIQMLERGEIHIADNLPPSALDELAKNPAIEILSDPGQNVGYLSINNEKAPLNDVEVRRAIWQAIDRQRLVDVVYAGHASPAYTLVPPTVSAHEPEIEARSKAERPFDPKAAREKMEAAAKAGGFTLPLRLRLFQMNQPRPYMQQPLETANFIRDALQPIGIEVEIVPIDLRQYWQRLQRGEHDLALAGWTSDNNDPENFLYNLLDYDHINDEGGNNLSRFRNEEMHNWLIAAQTEMDPAKREAYYRDAQRLVFDQAPLVPLVYTEVRTAQRKEVDGFDLHPTGLAKLRHARFATEAGAP
ncbi:MAG TPA: ABC transporter substrate-binding protein [Pirellulaceae bacterium]|jgi:peptide/nickel transport system substrate-binding protein|nr:ABC transporter substrate-binding protein [Pirellulaceae bacterium]